MSLDVDVATATIWAVDAGGATNLAAGARYPLRDLPSIDTLQSGEPYSVEDVVELEPPDVLAQLMRSEGLRALLSVPLTSQGHLIGALNLASDQPASFTPELKTIAGEVGDQLAIAIQNAQLFEQVRAGREQLQSLSRQLVRAQEDERRHLARELHDEIGQALTATQLNLQALLTLRDPRELPARLEDSMALIEGLLQQVRALSLDLRPSMLDDLGLAPALRWYLSRQAERAGFAVQFAAESSEMRYPSEIETTCFRIAQETVTNIVRHAQAQLVSVKLEQSANELCLLIRDDGVGFDVGAARARAGRGASLGLLGMHERAMLIGGQISIESAPAQGTVVRARFPLADRSGGTGPLERQKELP
jgi:signal transduction histidine kinase